MEQQRHKGCIWRLQGTGMGIEYDIIVYPRWKNVFCTPRRKKAEEITYNREKR